MEVFGSVKRSSGRVGEGVEGDGKRRKGGGENEGLSWCQNLSSFLKSF